jgi:hypothetical protein
VEVAITRAFSALTRNSEHGASARKQQQLRVARTKEWRERVTGPEEGPQVQCESGQNVTHAQEARAGMRSQRMTMSTCPRSPRGAYHASRSCARHVPVLHPSRGTAFSPRQRCVRWCSSPGDEGVAALLTVLRVKEEEVPVCRLCAMSRPSAVVGAHSWNALHRRAATTTQRGRGGARAEGSRSGGGAHRVHVSLRWRTSGSSSSSDSVAEARIPVGRRRHLL